MNIEYPVKVWAEGRDAGVACSWEGVQEVLEDYYEDCSVDIEDVEEGLGCHVLYIIVDGWNVETFITPIIVCK